MKPKITPYLPEGREAFYELNLEWLETYFHVEDFDREVLQNPEKYIIDPGGHIFFAWWDDSIVGTAALLPHQEGVLELTKMAVIPDLRGKKIGQQLLQHCIDFSRKQKFDKLLLYSNTVLENAIYLYRKYGFVEIELEHELPYLRSNIKMELKL